MKSVDKFLDKKFNRNSYNCLHFSRDVWLELTGEDITERLKGLLVKAIDRKISKGNRKAFKKLNKPVDPCIVVMQHPSLNPHMGVFVRGKVLHIQDRGVEFMPIHIASRGFKTVKFCI